MYPEYLVMDRHAEGLGMIFVGREARMAFGSVDLGSRTGGRNGVEQAVVYSTSTTGLSTLTFEGGVVAGGGGVEERSEVMYCIEEDMYIYYRDIMGHSYTV